MVGIVIVSHSEKLADGVKELALQMSQNKVMVVAAGGLDDESNPIGTDPIKIKEAIEEAASEDGVLVLMDIGSAVMNAEIATEMLTDPVKQKVILCEAPLAEGAIAAAAQSAAGADLKTVADEARNGLLGKASLLNSAPIDTGEKSNAQLDQHEIRIKVPNRLGLHARPSVKLVELVNTFNTEIGISVNNKPFVSAKSISQVGTLGAKLGDILVFRVQDSKVLKGLERKLMEFEALNFGDPKKEKTPSKQIPEQRKTDVQTGAIVGTAASKGIAIGSVKLLTNVPHVVEKKVIEDTLAEITLFRKSVAIVIDQIKELQHQTMVRYGKDDAEIFDFHILLLNDENTLLEVEDLIENKHWSAAYSWFQVYSNLEAKYLGMEELYLRERAFDISEIRNKLLDLILGPSTKAVTLKKPCIVLVDEIGPAQTLSLDTDKVLGIISKTGGKTSHATILARSVGIPAITGLADQVDSIKDNEVIGINGGTGEIWLEKTHPEKLVVLRDEKKQLDKILRERFKKAKLPAISKDGTIHHILANISSPKEAKIAFDNGAEGIGLYRTEFLFMNREAPPTEEEQYEVYKSACKHMNGLPVTIRTIDVGGDKPIPYLGIAKEANPFLGLRGIRYCLHNVALFKTQLRALCRLSAEYEIRVMYPMVGVVEEVLRANQILKEVRSGLKRENIPFSETMKTGIMVEVPSVIFLIPQLANELDFLSIGTNDLTQYLLALDRGNATVSQHYNALSPAVLAALRKIVISAKKAGLDLSLCGEIARDAKATKLLSEIGIKKFSMSSPAIPDIKETIRQMKISKTAYSGDRISQWKTLESVENSIGPKTDS